MPLDEGCEAPFSGQLLEPSLALSLGQGKQRAEEKLQLTLTSTRAYWTEVLRHRDELHAIALDAEKAKTQAALDRIEEVRPKFYERPAFIIPMTVLATVGIAIGTASLVDAVTD